MQKTGDLPKPEHQPAANDRRPSMSAFFPRGRDTRTSMCAVQKSEVSTVGLANRLPASRIRPSRQIFAALVPWYIFSNTV